MLAVQGGWWRRRLMKNVDRRDDAVGNAPLAPAISAHFLLEKCVHCPFDFVEKIFRKQESQFVGIGNVFALVKTARSEFTSRRRRPFVMQNVAGADLVFGENCRVQWDLVPIRERIPAFNSKGRVLG